MQAYDEATETVTVSVRAPQRECQTTDYARRSTVEGSLDTGSIPVYSTHTKGTLRRKAVFVPILQNICPLNFTVFF